MVITAETLDWTCAVCTGLVLGDVFKGATDALAVGANLAPVLASAQEPL